MHRLLRENELCRGGTEQARGCPSACFARCVECGNVWEVQDPAIRELCECGAGSGVVERCDTCPVLVLEEVRAHSHAGRMLERALELDFDLVTFPGNDYSYINTLDREGVRILRQERGKYEKEDREKRAEEAEAQRRMQTVQGGRPSF